MATGGSVLSPDGKIATIDSPQAQNVLALMQRGLKDGAVSSAILTYVCAYASKADVPFGVEPLPGFGNNPPSAVLGGYNLGISTYSKSPGAALSFINYATSPPAQKKFFVVSSLPAVIARVYRDPEGVKAQPYAPELLKSVEDADPRPVSPVYPQISQVIYKNVYSALSSGTSPQTALSNAQTQINAALKNRP